MKAGGDSVTKTNAMRLLEAAGIPFRVMEYEVDENDLSGVHVAAQLGQPVEQVFKTLVLKGDKLGYLVCCIPVAEELDLKKTGYIRGGCSPIGMKKKFPTFLDETVILFDEIAISAGVRGAQILLNPEDLMRYTEAVTGELTKES